MPPSSAAVLVRPSGRAAGALALAFGLIGCAAETEPGPEAPASHDDPDAGFDQAAIDEVVARGFGKYLGAFSPSAVDTVDGLTLYGFAPDPAGPICMKGGPFRMSIREGSTDDLLIYLQGGGACWTGKCAASISASGMPLTLGWTDGDVERNPLGGFPLAFIGYCDGSVFTGDNDVPDPANGDGQGIRRHHGLANLSAALDVAHARFPHPRRIVLAGSSAGGYGTLTATLIVRLLWPKTRLFVVNDAGLGLTNPDDPAMYDVIAEEWSVADRIPESCEECKGRQLTPLIGWALAHDPTLRAGAFSAYEDAVIGSAFLDMTGPAFRALLLEQTDPLHAAFPDRFQRFFIDGGAHTAILAGYYDVEVEGEHLPAWTAEMLDGESGAWVDRLAGGM